MNRSEAFIDAPVLTLEVSASESLGSPKQLAVESCDGPRSDPWIVDSWRRHNVTVISSDERFEVDVEPATLFFRAGTSERTLTIENRGNISTTIHSCEAPFGLQFDLQTPCTLAPAAKVSFQVRSIGEPSGSLKMKIGSANFELPVIHTKSVIRSIPKAYIGIDFGTSNTSVSFREFGSSRAQALDLFGQGQRIPTQVWCPGDEPSTWVYGAEAFDKWVNANRRGFYADQLKSQVRKGGQGLLHGSNSITYRQTVVELFKRIKNNVIGQHIARTIGREFLDGGLHLTLSVPVLDQDDEHDLYVTELLAISREAGLNLLGPVDYALEPVCAASFFLRDDSQSGRFSPGEQIIVFDSGGGTTDICSGVVEFRNEILTLSSIKSAAAMYSPDRQFGGTFVNWYIGWFWGRKDNKDRMDLQNLVQAIGSHHDPFEDEEFIESAKPRDGEYWPDWPWPRKYPPLFRAIEEVKLVAGDKAVAIGPSSLPGGNKNRFRVSQRMFEDVSINAVSKFTQALEEIANELPLNRTFLAGGNSYLPGLANEISKRGLHVEPLSAEMHLAVSKGGTWVAEWVSGGLPYHLDVVVADQKVSLRAGEKLPAGESKRVGTFQVPQGLTLDVSLSAQVGDRTFPILSRPLPLPIMGESEVVSARCSIEGQMLTIGLHAASGAKTEIHYPA